MTTDRSGPGTGGTVVVAGGGITGLSAAWRLSRAPRPPERIVVAEADERWGGKIRTSTFAGRPVEEGPDMFLARVRWAHDLAVELGLGEELVAPTTGAALVRRDGRSHRLPAELVLGVPSRLRPLVGSGLISWPGLARAALDLVKAPTPVDDDLAVGELIRQRFGDEVDAWLVDPLLGGINAGRSTELSLAASAPQLLAAARAPGRSLARALRDQRSSLSASDGPVFWTPRRGLGSLVEALVEQLTAAGVELVTGCPVDELGHDGARVRVSMGAHTLAADGLVLATPAPITARLLTPIAPEAARGLGALEHASVAMVRLEMADDDLDLPSGVSGLLVPRPEASFVTAVSMGSTKWPHWAGPGRVVLRVSVGRRGDERFRELDDDEIVTRVSDELESMLGLRRPAAQASVTRWIDSFPQYRPGHPGRVAAWRRELARVMPAAALAGAPCDGVGIPACIRQGGEAADQVMSHLADRMGPS